MKNYLTILIFLASSMLWAQNNGSPFYTNYLPTKYKAAAKNNDIAQNSEGVMFFANESGVLIYNSVNWTLIELPDKGNAKSVFADNSDKIYVGGNNEFGYITKQENGKYIYFSLRNLLPKQHHLDQIYTIHKVNNKIYYQSFNSLIEYTPNSCRNIATDNFQTAHSIDNRLFVNHRDNGLFELIDQKLELVEPTKFLAGKRIYCIVPFEKKNFLIATEENGIYILKNDYRTNPQNSLSYFETEADNTLKTENIYRMVMLPDSTYAIATRNAGMIVINRTGKLIRTITTEHGLQNLSIKDLFIDNQYRLWVALSKGISTIELTTPWTFWNEKNGLSGSVLNYKNHNNTIYVGTDQKLFYLNNSTFSEVNNIIDWTLELKSHTIGNQSVLIAANKKGIYRVDKNNAHLISDESSSVRYIYFYQDNKFIYYVRGSLKFAELIAKDKINVKYSYNRNDISLYTIIESPKQTFWFETISDGIYKMSLTDNYSPQSITIEKYDTLKGLPSNYNLKLFEFGDSFVLGSDYGLYSYNRQTDRFQECNHILGSFFKDKTIKVERIYKSENGDIYLSFYRDNNTWSELFQISPQNNYKIDSLKFRRLPKMEINFIKTNDQYLIVGGSEGLFCFDNSTKYYSHHQYHTLILSVKLPNDSLLRIDNRYKNVTQSEEILQLDFDKNSLIFEFSGTFYSEENENQYAYKLDGYNEKWSNWTKANTKEYTNLHEGNYTFRVKSKNIYGIESNEAQYNFTIKTPWYRTSWTIFIFGVLVFLFVFAVAKIYTLNLRKANVKLEQKVKKRTKQLEKQKNKIEIAYKNTNLIREFGQKITATLNFDEIRTLAQKYVKELMDADNFGIGILNEKRNSIEFINFVKKNEIINLLTYPLSATYSISVWCFSRVEEIVIDDFSTDKRKYINTDEMKDDEHSVSAIYLPLVLEGKTIGVITVQSFKKNAYSKTDVANLQLLCSYITVALNNARYYEIVTQQNFKIKSSIDYAQTIQNSILPLQTQIDKSLENFIIFMPKDIVSGDFYWYLNFNTAELKSFNNELNELSFIAAVDCTGHGVPGAFMSIIGYSLLNEIVKNQRIFDTAQILEQLNTGVYEMLQQKQNKNDDGMDICLCRIERYLSGKTKVMFTGAKRPLFYIDNDNLLIELKGDRKSIGGESTLFEPFTTTELLPEKGTLLLLTSDGYFDQNNADRKSFGKTRFKSVIEQNVGLPVKDIGKQLYDEIIDFMDNEMQRDDITVIGIRL